MFAALDDLIERRIDEARRQGAFDDLPGRGRPLELDDDRLVPEDLRVAFRILRNAGFVPPEVEALRDVDALLGTALDDGRAADATQAAGARTSEGRHAGNGDADGRRARRMVALAIALEQRGAQLTTGAALEYRRAFIDKLARG
ncbi:MAG TPA: DnaJ family domain-containing protein [Zeimonas sp.]|nr:DnaJ family domain-containing protein [Zeimonas sp.]